MNDILDILPCNGDGEEFVEAIYYGELKHDNFIQDPLYKVTKLEDGDSTTCESGYNPKSHDDSSHYCYKRYECMVPPTKPPTTPPTDPENTTSSSLSIVSSCLMILSLSALFL